MGGVGWGKQRWGGSASAGKTSLPASAGSSQRSIRNTLPPPHHRRPPTRSATEALKIVGESFPWTPAPGWVPPRRVPAGGVNETAPGHLGKCGKFDESSGDLDQSTYVYLRANHKVSIWARGRMGRQ